MRVMPRALNVLLAWIATALGMGEILFYLPRTLLVVLSICATAGITWALLHRFGIPRRSIQRAADRMRRELGY